MLLPLGIHFLDSVLSFLADSLAMRKLTKQVPVPLDLCGLSNEGLAKSLFGAIAMALPVQEVAPSGSKLDRK